jgi:hypothetical protein
MDGMYFFICLYKNQKSDNRESIILPPPKPPGSLLDKLNKNLNVAILVDLSSLIDLITSSFTSLSFTILPATENSCTSEEKDITNPITANAIINVTKLAPDILLELSNSYPKQAQDKNKIIAKINSDILINIFKLQLVA